MSHSLAFMSMPGGMEWLLILLVALLIFGKNLPQVMRELGRTFRGFRDSMGMGEDVGKDLSNPFRWDQEDANRLHPPMARPDPHSLAEIPPPTAADLQPASDSAVHKAAPDHAVADDAASPPNPETNNDSGVTDHDRSQ